MPIGASKLARLENPPDAALPGSKNPDRPADRRLLVLRTVFICALVLITLRVSMPQNETIWTAYDTPLDLVRLVLGFAVCIWLVIQLFKGPKDADGYRTWLYLGLVAVPFALICLIRRLVTAPTAR